MGRGVLADLPFYLKTILAVRQKSRQPFFWEVIDSFILLPYASLSTFTTLLEQLLELLEPLELEEPFCNDY